MAAASLVLGIISIVVALFFIRLHGLAALLGVQHAYDQIRNQLLYRRF